MSCSPFNLREYFFNELSESARGQTEAHVKTCDGCREELRRLRLTEASLLTLRDEEMPQRIAFVSDKVFEPSALRRWWSAFWGSTARLGFASAAMLSAAILVAALTRPPAPAPVAPAPAADLARLESNFNQRMNQALQEAVAQAVAESEKRHAERTAELLSAAERRHELDRRAILVAVEENLDVMRKRLNVMLLASADVGASQ
jgi:hypothetical protein